ncbi:MAG: 5-(carboxyamino)imidazole ribonucleotide synthase [Flavobacteriales bacterium]
MKSFYAPEFKLGILGGGQLGRMLIQEAINYNVRVSILDPDKEAPCAAISHEFIQGNFNDYDTVIAFGSKVDCLTVEIEHVNTDALVQLEKQGIKVYPKPSFLAMVKDKGLQKLFYQEEHIPTAPFRLTDDIRLEDAASLHFPFVLKSRTGGYDGKGVQIIKNPHQLADALSGPCVIEEMIAFTKELAIIVSRNESGQVSTFPLVEMEFNPEVNLVEFLFSPAAISGDIEKQAQVLAEKIVTSADFVGLLAIELFLTADGQLLVNEMAPRPHNSGHHTIEGCTTSQYEQHLRAILNLPPGSTRLVQPAVMVNLLGAEGFSGPAHYEGLEEVLSWSGVHVHLYGKSNTKPFRKMGHVTVTGTSLSEAQEKARRVLNLVRVVA